MKRLATPPLSKVRSLSLAVGIELAPSLAISSGGAGGTFDLMLTARLLL